MRKGKQHIQHYIHHFNFCCLFAYALMKIRAINTACLVCASVDASTDIDIENGET